MIATALVTLTIAAKGLAMADWSHPDDLRVLRVSWFYGWGENCNADSRCVNMVYAMQLPKACYDYLLVGNEPNHKEPFGAPGTPREAAGRVLAIENACPNTRLVVGNTSAGGALMNGLQWTLGFLREYEQMAARKFAQIIGVHCYSAMALDCIRWLKMMRKVIGGEMWLTEFGVLGEDLDGFKALLRFVSYNFSRYAVYTNRQPAQGYVDGWAVEGLDLITPEGWPTPVGEVYARWP